MNELCVIVPTRGRPANAVRLVDAWDATNAKAHLLLALDDDDPMLDEYLAALAPFENEEHPYLGVVVGERLRLGPTLNFHAIAMAQTWETIGFMGDDHLPTTPLWDREIVKAIRGMNGGLVYGNDLLQGEFLPTAVFISATIVRALGYFCPPDQTHLYLDDAWKAWGERSGRLCYLEDVVIEHLHPLAGKAEHDAGYEEVNGGAMWSHDEAAWRRYQQTQMRPDVVKIREAVRV